MVRDTGEGYHSRSEMLRSLKDAGFKYGKDYEIIDVPNIVNITYGRDVGYKIEQEFFDKEIEDIRATEIRNKMEGVYS